MSPSAAPDPQAGFEAGLSGGGSLVDAVAKVRADAANDLPEASLLLATLAGAGVGMAKSFPDALQHLVKAARNGSEAARGQLEVLGRADGMEGDSRWATLAASVRLEDWFLPATKQVLNAAPRVVAVPGFLEPRVCDWLIGLSRGRLRPAQIYAEDGSPALNTGGRNNSAIEFGLLNCDLVVLLVRERIASNVGVPAGALENSQVLHYEVGQEFVRHYDYLDPKLPEVAERGQRMATFLVYLNADFDGGETEFPQLNLKHKGGAGAALYFANLNPAGAPDPRTLHAGLPPTRGEKWLFSQWVRNRARVPDEAPPP